MVEIKNENLKVQINTLGAELQSVKSSDGFEYLWQGDPEVWSGRAPVLFPIVGGLMDDEFIYDGKAYKMSKHGFARISEFEAEEVDTHKAVFLLKSNSETKKQYPFDFEFRVSFVLKDNKMEVEYRVDNTDQKDIYFSFGAHEAYACAGGVDGYLAEFDSDERLFRHMVTGNFINGEKIPVSDGGNLLVIKDEFFEDDALIFRDIESKVVSLYKPGTDKKVTVEYPDFKNLLIWTKPGAEYLCIEPWDGIPDSLGCGKEIKNKDEIVTLSAGKTYARTHTITFE